MSPAIYSLHVAAPNCVNQARVVEFTEGEIKELEPIRLEVCRKMSIEYVGFFDGKFKITNSRKKTLAAGDDWTLKETPMRIGQKDGKLLLSSANRASYITDLGAARLVEMLDVAPNPSTRQPLRDSPVEDGHVYLVEPTNGVRPILFRTTLVDN